MEDTALEKISKAEILLSQVETPTEAADIADMAAAAAAYAKRQRAALPVVNKAQDIKIRAERKAGEMLSKMAKNKGTVVGGDIVSPPDNTPRLSDLGITKKQSSRWQQAASVSEEIYRELVESCSKREVELTSNAVIKLAPKKTARNGAKEATIEDGIFTDLAQLQGKQFGCIYADPPWRYDNQGTRASTDNHYDTMSVDEICAMPIEELAADKAHLHLWTTNAFLFECPKILEAWGFEYRSTFVWVKPQMGIGNYWRCSHEIMITARRGGQTGISKSEMSWVECKRGRHSSKPQQVRESIERLSPGPYLELFGRRAVPNWAVFGNQVIEELV